MLAVPLLARSTPDTGGRRDAPRGASMIPRNPAEGFRWAALAHGRGLDVSQGVIGALGRLSGN